jgi:hypothetical protein
MSIEAIDMRSPSSSNGPPVEHVSIRQHEARQQLRLLQLLEDERTDVPRHVVLHLESHHLTKPALKTCSSIIARRSSGSSTFLSSSRSE